jgi:hypothetical protein
MQGSDASTSSPTVSRDVESPHPSDSSTPPNDPSASVAHLPVHAGFDLEAIRKVLNEVKPEEMKIQQPTPQVVQPSSPRPGSAPPAPPGSDTHASSSSLHSGNGEPGPGPRSMSRDRISDRLSAPFKRTMSLDDEHDGCDDVEDEHPYTQRSTSSRTPQSSREDTSFVDTPRFSHRPMPFANDATLSWKPSTEPDSFSPGVTPTYGYGPLSASPFNNYSHTSQNPFSSFPPSDAGLSFGGVDGSITSLSTNTDPWQAPRDIGKKASTAGFNSNPWT